MAVNLKKSVISGLFWKFLELFSTDIINFVVSIILARLLMPKDYGEIAIVMVFIRIASVFVITGLGMSLVQKKDSDDLDFSSIFYLNLIVSIIIYALFYFFAPNISKFYNNSHLIIILRVLALYIPLSATLSIQNAYVSKYMIFKTFFYSKSIGNILSAIVGIYMAYKNLGTWALIAQLLSNSIFNSIIIWIIIPWHPKFMFSFSRVKPLFNFGIKILLSGLIRQIYNQLSNLVIGKLYSPQDLAFFNRGQKYPELVISNVNSSISSVLFPAISKVQDNKNKVKEMTRKSIRTTTFIMTPMLIGLAVLAKPIVILMLTEKWLPCVIYMQVSCLFFLLQPIQTANLEAIRAIGRSDIILTLDIIKRGFGVVMLLLLMHKGVFAICMVGVFMMIFSTFVNIMPNAKLINYSFAEQFKDILPNFLLSAFMGGIMYICSLKLINYSYFFNIMVCICIGIIIYIGLAVLFKIEILKYIFLSIKELKK